MTDVRLGTVLQDRYRVTRLLGEGGMGAVYEGEHVLLGRRVAIKFLHAALSQDAGAVARFLREAKSATAVQHKHIVEVTDMGQADDGAMYIVLEYLEGRDWSEDLEQTGPQSVSKVVHIVSQVCEALEAAHAANIVHRDLKPENIFLLNRDGDPDYVKVVDFGISKVLGADNNMTKSGAVLGTPYYMSPEQARNSKAVDARADLYSLGVILFRVLSHRFPFEGESYGDLVVKICVEPPRSLLEVRPDLPGELVTIVDQLLSKNPEDRPASATALRRALSAVRTGPSRTDLGNAATQLAMDAVGPTLSAGVGTLRITSIPWAKVYIDGESTERNTPIRSLRVPAGVHTLGFETPDGMMHEEEVTVVAGETRSLVRRFGETASDGAAMVERPARSGAAMAASGTAAQSPRMTRVGRMEATPAAPPPEDSSSTMLSPSVVSRVVRRHQSSLQSCARNASVEGRAELGLRIAASGRVISAVVRDPTFENRTVTACIRRNAYEWRFPSAESATRVRLPLVFQAPR